MSVLTVENMKVSRGPCEVFRNVGFKLYAGELVGLVGPNGAGKTTLMRACLGLLKSKGYSSLASLPESERAKTAAWMPQSREIAWPVTVETLVGLGRTPHIPLGRKMTPADRTLIDRAIDYMELQTFRHRNATRLSGGEQARVLIARALAQDTPLLLADEPIAGLDPAHQISTMKIFSRLAQEGRTIVVSLHDLGLAARHCTRLIMLGQGRLAADGRPSDILTAERIAQVFGISAFFEKTSKGPVFQALEVTS